VSVVWWVVLGLIVVCSGTRMVGPAVLGDRELPAPARRVVMMLAPALLAGLVVTQVAGERWNGLEAGLIVGVAAAGVARLLRVPGIGAVAIGVAVAAAVRAFLP
jgi:branched-subunit amino acid transport protein